MKKVKFIRKKNKIFTVREKADPLAEKLPPEVKEFASNNLAKKESRRLQLEADGKLGLGSLRNES